MAGAGQKAELHQPLISVPFSSQSAKKQLSRFLILFLLILIFFSAYLRKIVINYEPTDSSFNTVVSGRWCNFRVIERTGLNRRICFGMIALVATTLPTHR